MRPKKYNEETKVISIRIPLSEISRFKKVSDEFLRQYEFSKINYNLPKPEYANTQAKPKWAIDAEERMKRNK